IVAERLAVSSASGLPAVVSKLHRAIRRAGNWEATHLVWPNNTRMAVLPLRRGTDALLISQNLVTNAQYRRFVQQTRSNEPLGQELVRTGRRGKRVGPFAPWRNDRFGGPSQPVVCVSARECVAYCRWLSRQLARNGS